MQPGPREQARGRPRRASELAKAVEQMSDAPRRVKSPGEERCGNGSERHAREDQQGPQRNHSRGDRDHGKRAEPEQMRRADRRADAGDAPHAAFALHRAGVQRESDRRPELGRRERVDQRARTETGRGIDKPDRRAKRPERGPPDGAGDDQRPGETAAGDPEPRRRGLIEPRQTVTNIVAEQLGRRQCKRSEPERQAAPEHVSTT